MTCEYFQIFGGCVAGELPDLQDDHKHQAGHRDHLGHPHGLLHAHLVGPQSDVNRHTYVTQYIITTFMLLWGMVKVWREWYFIHIFSS